MPPPSHLVHHQPVVARCEAPKQSPDSEPISQLRPITIHSASHPRHRFAQPTRAFPPRPQRITPKPPSLPIEPQSIPTLPSRLSNNGDPLPSFPSLSLLRLAPHHPTKPSLSLVLTPSHSTQASTLRLFCEIRFLLFF